MARHPAVGSVAWTLAYAASMEVGRELAFPGEPLAIVWPACGVATLWLLGRRGRILALDLALIAVVTFAVNTLTGAPLGIALWFIPVNISQAVVGAWMLERLCPGLWRCGGQQTFDSSSRFSRLLLTAIVSSLVAVLVATAGRGWVLGPASLQDFAIHWGRNTFGFLAVVVVAHLCAHAWAFRDPERPLVPRERYPELVMLSAATVLVYGGVFGLQSSLPLAFVPGAVSIWAGLRFAPAVVAVQCSVASVLALAGTLADRGPFSLVDDRPIQGLLVQLMMTIIVAKGISLAAVRADGDRYLRQVEEARLTADRQARLMATIVDTMEPGLVVLDPAGEPLRQNAPAAALMMLRPTPDDTEQDVLPTSWETVWAHVASTAEPAPIDLSLDGADRDRVVNVRPAPMLDHAGARTGTVVMLTDVTEERAARAQLVNFAGTVAHDLRSPLVAVRGWNQAVTEELRADEPDLDLVAMMVGRLDGSAARMNELIDDLLAHAVSRDGRLHPTTLPLDQAVADVVESLAEGEVVVHESVDVHADAGLVRHLLTNLLGNAFKYVAPGVTPRVEVTATRDEDLVEVRLADNGIGIPAEHRAKIFDQFHRVSEGYSGTGLGLAICRTIVERHGGGIHVEENPTGGSCFVFTLPASTKPRQPTGGDSESVAA